MRPKSITVFQILAWIAVGLMAIGLLILLVVLADIGFGRLPGAMIFALVLVLALTVGMAITTFLAARKRSNGARMTYVGIAVVTILLIMLGMAGENNGTLSILLNILQIGLLGGAITFLFQRDSNAWFRGDAHQGGYGGGYPPQHGGGYPPQHGRGYPPQQGGYPQQQGGGYPPQQGGGYPPQQGGGYPPSGGGHG